MDFWKVFPPELRNSLLWCLVEAQSWCFLCSLLCSLAKPVLVPQFPELSKCFSEAPPCKILPPPPPPALLTRTGCHEFIFYPSFSHIPLLRSEPSQTTLSSLLQPDTSQPCSSITQSTFIWLLWKKFPPLLLLCRVISLKFLASKTPEPNKKDQTAKATSRLSWKMQTWFTQSSFQAGRAVFITGRLLAPAASRNKLTPIPHRD